jgi:hypothetical protein
MARGPWRNRRLLGSLLAAAVLSLPACGGDHIDPIPGLDEAAEVPLIEAEPDSSDASFNWTHAYRVGDLPPLNVGQPTADFMADAHRDPEGAANLVCMEAGGGGGCSLLNSADPAVGGETYGGPDIRAWSWTGVPAEAVAVQFTDQDGTVTWQRPASEYRLVIFPDTVANDPDGECSCRFDAIDADGAVISSVDIRTLTYVDD